MASLRTMFAHTAPRIEHVGVVVTLPALLEQRRAARDGRLRFTEKMAGGTIIAGSAADMENNNAAG
jgi:hypothetical protein